MIEPILDPSLKNGFCYRCKRRLKNQESIEIGFGKICLEKYLKETKRTYKLIEIGNKK